MPFPLEIYEFPSLEKAKEVNWLLCAMSPVVEILTERLEFNRIPPNAVA